MAALGWLLNLDFAGGTAAVEEPSGSVMVTQRRPGRYGYGYGYRYAEVLRCLLICF